MKKKTVSVILAAVMGLGLLAGCGGDKKAEGTDAKTEDKKDEASKDDAEKKDGEGKTFIVGFDAEYPPYGYMDDNGE